MILGELYTCSLTNAKLRAFPVPGGPDRNPVGVSNLDILMYLGVDQSSLQDKFWFLNKQIYVWVDTWTSEQYIIPYQPPHQR
jgi:hypothetical protein